MTESASVGPRSAVPNPALEPFRFLIGDWRTSGSHPAVPGRSLEGRTSFSWHHGGAFLLMRSEVDEPGFPDGIALIGTDDGSGRHAMIYFDERAVSRVYQVTIGDEAVTWSRDDPELAQSVTIRAQPGGELVSVGRMSQRGGPWGDDLSQTFTRIR